MNGTKTKRAVWGMRWVAFWILLRCVYRVVELNQGFRGYLITHELYLIFLDTIPMVFVQAGFLFMWPEYTFPRQAVSPPAVASPAADREHGSDCEDENALKKVQSPSV
ncbi:hypothetical protein ACM66B_002868 [Microbotryomycetes sp. NB124-2]